MPIIVHGCCKAEAQEMERIYACMGHDLDISRHYIQMVTVMAHVHTLDHTAKPYVHTCSACGVRVVFSCLDTTLWSL